MSTTINAALVEQFGDTVTMLAEQTMARLRGAVRIKSVKAEMWSAERLGGISATEVSTRFSQMSQGDINHDRRWGFIRAFDVEPLFIDQFDRLRMVVDFRSPYSRRIASALARAQDDTIIAALDGPVTVGKQGGSTTNFPGGVANQDVFSFSTGTTPGPLNLDTLLRAKARLLSAEAVDNPDARVTVLLNENAWLSLLQDNRFVNGDFSRFYPLESGRLPPYLGMQFIRSQRLPEIVDGTYDGGAPANRVFMFTEDAIEFGENQAIVPDISQRKDLRLQPWQVYAWGSWGALRVEDVQVVRILARRTT